MTTIYFMRHSEALKFKNINNNDSLQLQNEKWPLTINGEKLAKEKSELNELRNFDHVYSSNYVRAIPQQNILQAKRLKLMNHLEKEDLE